MRSHLEADFPGLPDLGSAFGVEQSLVACFPGGPGYFSNSGIGLLAAWMTPLPPNTKNAWSSIRPPGGTGNAGTCILAVARPCGSSVRRVFWRNTVVFASPRVMFVYGSGFRGVMTPKSLTPGEARVIVGAIYIQNRFAI